MWQKLHCISSRSPGDLSQSSDQLIPPFNHFIVGKQALIYEGLFCVLPPKTTIANLTTRGGQRW
jgi:hypothetical protein